MKKLFSIIFFCELLYSCSDTDSDKTTQLEPQILNPKKTYTDTIFYNQHKWDESTSLIKKNPEIEMKTLGQIKTLYSGNFTSNIVGIYEGGDCSPIFYLHNTKDSTLLGSCLLAMECSTDLGYSEHYSIQNSDTTFSVTLRASGTAQDATGKYLIDKSDKHLSTSKHLINSNGSITLINTADSSWRVNEKYDYKF